MINHKISSLIIVFFVALIISLSGCASNSSKLKSSVETFFIGEAGTQYFVKPMNFEDEDGNELIADITFRYKDELKDSSTINFTIETKDLNKEIKDLIIKNETFEVFVNKYQLLFAEKNGSKFKSRFSVSIKTLELNELIKNENWTFDLDTGKSKYKYLATNETKSILKLINEELFVLFR